MLVIIIIKLKKNDPRTFGGHLGTDAISSHTCPVGDKSGKTASHGRMPMKEAVDNAVCGRAVSCCEMMSCSHDIETLLQRLAVSWQPPHSTSLMAFAKTQPWQDTRCAPSLQLCAQVVVFSIRVYHQFSKSLPCVRYHAKCTFLLNVFVAPCFV